MRTGRPRHTLKDANHPEMRGILRQVGCLTIDTADLPGHPRYNPLDMFVLGPSRRVWVEVEVKVGPDAPFTKDERAFLELVGAWPPWEPHDVAVLAAHDWQQVVRRLWELGETSLQHLVTAGG